MPVARFRAETLCGDGAVDGRDGRLSGAIGFVGLLVPHFVGLTGGSDNVRVIPLSALVGAVVLILPTSSPRTIMAPEDVPIGVITGLVGGLSFILLLRRR